MRGGRHRRSVNIKRERQRKRNWAGAAGGVEVGDKIIIIIIIITIIIKEINKKSSK